MFLFLIYLTVVNVFRKYILLSFIPLGVRSALSLPVFEGKCKLISKDCCAFFRTAQTTKQCDPKKESPDKVKYLQPLYRFMVSLHELTHSAVLTRKKKKKKNPRNNDLVL